MNPIKEARLQQHLSQAELAKLSGVSRLAVLRLEQGLFTEPLPTVLDSLDLPFNFTAKAYYDFQKEQRKSNIPLPPVEPPYNNWLSYRYRYWPTQAGFCVKFCVAQANLSRFENNYPYTMMPAQLREALDQAGMLKLDIDQLATGVRAHAIVA